MPKNLLNVLFLTIKTPYCWLAPRAPLLLFDPVKILFSITTEIFYALTFIQDTSPCDSVKLESETRRETYVFISALTTEISAVVLQTFPTNSQF